MTWVSFKKFRIYRMSVRSHNAYWRMNILKVRIKKNNKCSWFPCLLFLTSLLAGLLANEKDTQGSKEMCYQVSKRTMICKTLWFILWEKMWARKMWKTAWCCLSIQAHSATQGIWDKVWRPFSLSELRGVLLAPREKPGVVLTTVRSTG